MNRPPPWPAENRQPQPRRGREWLTPLASKRQRRGLLLFVALWLFGVVRFGLWWFDPSHQIDTFGTVATSAIIGFVMVLPTWLFFACFRARRPRDDLSFGAGRVAMVVTKAPSEPWALVRHTLTAMLHQSYLSPYDVWLADEAPTEEALAWCKEKGVKVSSRHDVADYHQPSWPRRTKSKEGNLAYFYDHWGYRDYDIVCQFDADHVPRPDYLRFILRGFADPSVGYVAAPSICSAGSDDSWTARGRLHNEANLHGVLQAGHNDGFAPTCIGSHYAVRTQALKEIGGVGPELAEDFSTSFLLAAHGWKGVFAIDAIAEGEGPHTFVDGMTQELQWARSLTTVALRYSKGHWRNLRWTERFRFGFTLCWYPMFVTHLFLGFLLSPLALILNRTWVSVTFIEFGIHAAVPTMSTVALLIFLRRQRWLRPVEVPVLSWEAALFKLTRWPWNGLGIMQSVVGALRGKELSFRVTPKTRDGGIRPLPVSALVPSLLVTLLQSGTVLLVPDDRPYGYLLLATIAGLVYGVAIVAVLLLHIREDGCGRAHGLLASAPSLALALVAVGISGLAGWRTARIGLSTWSDMNAAGELFGTSFLTTPSAAVYFAAGFALAGYALWDRRTSDEHWWLREVLDQLEMPREPVRPHRLPPLPKHERTADQDSGVSSQANIATSSSGP